MRKQRQSIILHVSRPVKGLLRRFSLFVLVVVSLAFIVISKSDSPIVETIRISVIDITTPAVNVITWPVRAISNAKNTVEEYFFVFEKNKEMRKENRYLKRKLTMLSDIESENARLYKLLKIVKKSEYKYISARVVGDTTGPFVNSILINAGKKQGVKKGQAVINEEGLVGRIFEVGNHSARVLLVTDINSKIPVISSESRERSIVEGNNNTYPKLVYLPDDGSIHEGERVITSGDGDVFPPGLQVGVVYALTPGTFKVKPFVKYNRLEHVSVIDYNKVNPQFSLTSDVVKSENKTADDKE